MRVSQLPKAWTSLPWLGELERAGGRVYVVGGALRDFLRGNASRDLDLVVGGLPVREIRDLLEKHGRVDCVGAAFAVLKWRAASGAAADIALPRMERSTGPGHRDFGIRSDPALPIEADLSRRDFTINAMALELSGGQLIDPWQGRQDLERRSLRAVGDAATRFAEDPLRILRGARLCAELGFAVDPATKVAMCANTPLLRHVAPERISTELLRLLSASDRPSTGLRMLVDVGAMAQVLPEYLPMVGFAQNCRHHHLPVDEHTLLSVDEAAARTPDPAVRLAALLHDIGKPHCYSESLDSKGCIRGHFYGHAARGAEAAAELLKRLHFSAVEGFQATDVDDVLALIRHHLVRLGAGASDRSLRRLVRRVGGGAKRLRRLLLLHRADRAAHAGGSEDEAIAALEERLASVAGDVPRSPHDLALSGGELQSELGLKGPAIGALQKRLLDRVVDGDLPNQRKALLKAARASL